jgi:hypothetical protein
VRVKYRVEHKHIKIYTSSDHRSIIPYVEECYSVMTTIGDFDMAIITLCHLYSM